MAKSPIFVALITNLIPMIIFGAFSYIDAKQTLANNFEEILRFGLRPSIILFFGLAPIPLWFSYNAFYRTLGSRFWEGFLIRGFLIQFTILVGTYMASNVNPTKGQWVALGLTFIATICSFT